MVANSFNLLIASIIHQVLVVICWSITCCSIDNNCKMRVLKKRYTHMEYSEFVHYTDNACVICVLNNRGGNQN